VSITRGERLLVVGERRGTFVGDLQEPAWFAVRRANGPESCWTA
jgi:hypothetical protein